MARRKRKNKRQFKQRQYAPPDIAHLTTAVDVVAALGGLARTAQIVECKSTTSIHNWIAFDQFPAKFFKVMTVALEARGYTAAHALWDQRGNHDMARKALERADADAA